jgi:hypothetical protein
MGLDNDGVLLILDSVPDRRAKRRVRPRVEPGRTPDRPKPFLVRMLLSFQRPVLPPTRRIRVVDRMRARLDGPAERTGNYSKTCAIDLIPARANA